MITRSRLKFRLGGAVALVGVALVVAACGSSSTTTSGAAAPAASASSSSTVSRASATGVSVGTAKGSSGTYLTGASGRALYLWVADKKGVSSCTGACAQAWPPVTSKATPIAAGGVKSAQLATITRADGTKQVTYDGHPLYYFAGDQSAGTTTGQGSPEFGAKWWLVTPSGSAITSSGSAAPASTAPASSSSSSSAGGGWG